MYRVPTATYRLQFNSQFTFDDARRVAGYLARLGISDIYASPILKVSVFMGVPGVITLAAVKLVRQTRRKTGGKAIKS